MQLKDHAAIVTGGASGLGAATARRLAAQGAKVAVCDLNAKLAESVAAEIRGVAVVCDVADAASAEAAIVAASKAHGPARVLVNCAGIGIAKRVFGREGPMPLADFGGNALRELGIEIADGNPGALFREPARGRRPQSRCSPGDDDGLILQLHGSLPGGLVF